MPWGSLVSAAMGGMGSADIASAGQAQQQSAAAQGQSTNSNFWGQASAATYLGSYIQQLPPQYIQQSQMAAPRPHIMGILEEFNRAFQYGIREVVVSKEVYQDLNRYLATRNYYINNIPQYESNYLTIATGGGYLIVKREGFKDMTTAENFDRYLEVVDEKLP